MSLIVKEKSRIKLIDRINKFQKKIFGTNLSISLADIRIETRCEVRRGGGKFDVNGCNSMRRPEQAPFNPLWANVQVTAEHWTSDSVVLTAVAGLLTARSTTSLANYLQFTTKVASGASLSSSSSSSSLVLDIHCSLPLSAPFPRIIAPHRLVLSSVNYGWFFSCNFYAPPRLRIQLLFLLAFGERIDYWKTIYDNNRDDWFMMRLLR